MSTEPRTVAVPVLAVHTETLPDPDWCAGGHDHAQFREDIDHSGPEHPVTHDGDTILTAQLAQAPHARDARLLVYVELGSLARSLDPTGVYSLAADLERAADLLRTVADEAAALHDRGEHQ